MSAVTEPPPTRSTGWAEATHRGLGPTRGWRPALRMGWRDLRRHRGRTAAAVVMVLLPVLAACGAAVVLATLQVSYAEQLRLQVGDGEQLAEWLPYSGDGVVADPPPEEAEVERLLGTDVFQVVRGSTSVSSPTRAARADTVLTDLTDPASSRVVVLLDGRLPQDGDEVAVSPGLAEVLRVTTGGTVALGEDERTVVGLAVGRYQDPSWPSLLLPSVGDPEPGEVTQVTWVADSFGRTGDLDGTGISIQSPQDYPGTPLSGDTVLLLAVAVALAALEIALLAGPAFAVGVRQQERTLALVAATGGDARALTRVVLGQALLVGVVASLGAGLVAVLGSAAVLTALRYRVPLTIGPLEVPWGPVLGFVVVGVLAALASALVPALTAVRATVVRGLSPRPARARVPWRRPLAGALLLLVGTGMVVLAADQGRSSSPAVVVDAGTVGPLSILVLGVGMVLVVPLPVALVAGATRRLPLGVRLAGRETTRTGARSVAAVAAVAGATAGLVAATCLTTALAEQDRQLYVPSTRAGVSTVFTGDVAGARARVVEALPTWRTAVTGEGGAQQADGGQVRADYWLPTPGCEEASDAGVGDCLGAWLPEREYRYAVRTAVLDRDAVTLLGYDLDEDQLDVLDAGGVLLARSAQVPLSGGRVELREWTQTFEVGGGPDPQGRPNGAVEVPVARFDPVEVSTRGTGGGQAVLVVSPAAAERLGGWYPVSLLAAPPGAEDMTVEVAQAGGERLRDLLGPSSTDVYGETAQTVVQTEVGFQDRYRVVELGLLGVAALVVLGATLTATALALADARQDRGVLSALGASPVTQRVMAGSTAGLLALTGAVVGGLVGLVPGVLVGDALLEPSVVSYGLGRTDGTFVAAGGALDVVPWWALGAGVIGLPLLAGVLVAAVASGRPVRDMGGADGGRSLPGSRTRVG